MLGSPEKHDGHCSWNDGKCTTCLADSLRHEREKARWRSQQVLFCHSAEAHLHPLVLLAEFVAMGAHTKVSQTRKYTGEPYYTHPKAVVERVMTVSHSPAMLCAAWLHDVLDDTAAAGANADFLRLTFGNEVAQMVQVLSAPELPGTASRQAKKLAYAEQLREQSVDVKSVKLADLWHNYESLVARDAKFAASYVPQGFLMLDAVKGGDPELYYQARLVLEKARAELKAMGIAEVPMMGQ